MYYKENIQWICSEICRFCNVRIIALSFKYETVGLRIEITGAMRFVQFSFGAQKICLETLNSCSICCNISKACLTILGRYALKVVSATFFASLFFKSKREHLSN